MNLNSHELKKKTAIYILGLTTIALSGVLIMQMFWVDKALRMKQELFDHRVTTALRAVVNGLSDLKYDAIYPELHRQGEYCRFSDNNFLRFVNKQQFDSLVGKSLVALDIDQEFAYGVYQKASGEFILGDPGIYSENLKSSKYFVSLDCLDNEHSIVLMIYFPYQASFIFQQMRLWIFLSGIFMVLVMAGFSFSVYSWLRQKKLESMKSDFVNNMTHEFKTPIATISLSSEMLLKQEVYKDEQKLKRYAGIIYEENYRLKKMVEQVLQTAVLEKGDICLKARETDIHKLLDKGILLIEEQLKHSGGRIEKSFTASPSTVMLDRFHIANVISNLLDNAIKYSLGPPQIIVGTRNHNDGVLFWVKDHGIGIENQHKKHIFKQFYRGVNGDVHDTGGFGIGLFYVRSIVEAHGGSVCFESELRKGSTFEVFLPYNANFNQNSTDGTTESNNSSC